MFIGRATLGISVYLVQDNFFVLMQTAGIFVRVSEYRM